MNLAMRRILVLLLALVLAPVAVASGSAKQVIRDCTDDEVLQGDYSQAELKAASKQLPDDAVEYTNCKDIIRQAQVRGARGVNPPPTPQAGSGGGSGGSSGGSAGGAAPSGAINGVSEFGGFGDAGPNPLSLATKAEKKQLKQDRRSGSAVQDVGGVRIAPGVATKTAEASSSLPAPLTAMLAILAAGALGAVALALRRRRAPTPRRRPVARLPS